MSGWLAITSLTSRCCLPIPYLLGHRRVMLRFNSGSGMTGRDWEMSEARPASIFGSVTNEVCCPLHFFRLIHSADTQYKGITDPTLLTPLSLQLQQQVAATIALAASINPQLRLGLLSSCSFNVPGGAPPPKMVHAWVGAARKGNIEALSALLQLQACIGSGVSLFFVLSQLFCQRMADLILMTALVYTGRTPGCIAVATSSLYSPTPNQASGLLTSSHLYGLICQSSPHGLCSDF